MTNAQNATQAQAALLRNDGEIATPVKNSLCCAAAGITALSNSTTEGLIPHKKLREAAPPEATLNAQKRPPAQPVVGYIHASGDADPFQKSTPGRRYWPADLTAVRPEEWALMSPKHVAEFAGMTEVWLLLDAAQQHIAELVRDRDLHQNNLLIEAQDHALNLQAKVDALQTRLNSVEQLLDEQSSTDPGEIERLRKDAERYQVLRQADVDTIHNGGLFAGLTPENIVLNGRDLDERVDAVITSHKAVKP